MNKKKGQEDSGNKDNRGGVVHFCRICGAVFSSADALDYHKRVAHAWVIGFRISMVQEFLRTMRSSVADDDLEAVKNRSKSLSRPSDGGSKRKSSKSKSSSLSSSFGDNFGRYTCELCDMIFALPHTLKSHQSACRGRPPGHSDSKDVKIRNTSDWGSMGKRSKPKNSSLSLSLRDQYGRNPCELCNMIFTLPQDRESHRSACRGRPQGHSDSKAIKNHMELVSSGGNSPLQVGVALPVPLPPSSVQISQSARQKINPDGHPLPPCDGKYQCKLCFRIFPTYQSRGGHMPACRRRQSQSDSLPTQQPSGNVVSPLSQAAADSALPPSANSDILSVPGQAKIDLNLQLPSSADATCLKFDLNKPPPHGSDDDDDDNAPSNSPTS